MTFDVAQMCYRPWAFRNRFLNLRGFWENRLTAMSEQELWSQRTDLAVTRLHTRTLLIQADFAASGQKGAPDPVRCDPRHAQRIGLARQPVAISVLRRPDHHRHRRHTDCAVSGQRPAMTASGQLNRISSHQTPGVNHDRRNRIRSQRYERKPGSQAGARPWPPCNCLCSPSKRADLARTSCNYDRQPA